MWMALLRLSVRVLGLISTVILARLLVPADFGLIAMATSVVAFLELATAFSFDVPLIQKQNADRRHFDTAWTLNLLFYSSLTVLLVVLAEPAAAFYQDNRLTLVIYVLAGGFLARGFENIGVVHFQKDLNFRKDFVLMFSKKLAGFLVAVPLAFYLESYWALVIGIIAGDITGVLLTYALHPFRPRVTLSQASEMLNFSKWLILNNAIGFLRLRSPDFIIGRISGSGSLGLFNIAFEISTLPTTELIAPINRAVFPGYSKLAGDLRRLRDSYTDVLAVVALLAFPASLGISAVAEPLVAMILGEKWAAAAPLIAILAIFGGINAIQTNSSSVFHARGKPHLITVAGTINVAVLLILAIPMAIAFGPTGVAVAYVCAITIIAPVTFFLVCREIELGPTKLISVLWRPLLAGIGMYGAIHLLDDYVSESWSLGPPALIGILVPAGALIYVVFSLILWRLVGQPKSADYRLTLVALRKLQRLGGIAPASPG